VGNTTVVNASAANLIECIHERKAIPGNTAGVALCKALLNQAIVFSSPLYKLY
jgi:hypothetical protein